MNGWNIYGAIRPIGPVLTRPTRQGQLQCTPADDTEAFEDHTFMNGYMLGTDSTQPDLLLPTSLSCMLHKAAHNTAPLRSCSSGMKTQYSASPAILMISPPNEYTMLTRFE